MLSNVPHALCFLNLSDVDNFIGDSHSQRVCHPHYMLFSSTSVRTVAQVEKQWLQRSVVFNFFITHRVIHLNHGLKLLFYTNFIGLSQKFNEATSCKFFTYLAKS